MRYIYSIRFLFFLVIAVMISACSRNPVTGKKQLSFMSESQEIALGASSDPQVTATYGLYQNSKMQSFIDEKGQMMAKISHRPELKYEFKILDSPVINAFAVPGGYVYFTRGIMAHFNNEAEFAGVLGHEIGHITARHSVNQQTKQILGQIAFIGGLIVSEDFRNFANEAQQGLGLLFMKFSRDHETQSDELGVEYSTKIGYDAVEMAEFYKTLSRMQEQSGQSLPTIMSTHPDPGNRYNNVKALAQEHKKNNPDATYSVNRDSYLALIDGMIYGEDPRQGFVENNRFNHPDLKFEFGFPTKWNLINTPSMVQIANEDGDALITFKLGAGSSPSEAASTFAEENQLTIAETTNVNVNGNAGVAMISDYIEQVEAGQTAQAAEPLRMLTYFIKYGQYIYQFNGVAKKTDFNNFFSEFQSTMKSFKALTDENKLNRQPSVLSIKTVKRTGTFLTALESYGVSGTVAVNEHVLLNGIEEKEAVKVGTKIKIVVDQSSSN